MARVRKSAEHEMALRMLRLTRVKSFGAWEPQRPVFRTAPRRRTKRTLESR